MTAKTVKTEHDPDLPHGGVDVDDQADAVDHRPRRDPLDVLRIAELDAGSRALGGSIVRQITSRGDRYEQALAVLLWLHKRRTDRSTEPGELLRQLRQLTFVEVSQQLDEIALQLGADDPADADPLAPPPA